MKSTIKYLFVLAFLTQVLTQSHAQWVSQVSGTTNQLTDVHFANANTGGACGISSIILRTTNAGTNWFIQPNPTAANLWGIAYTTPLVGVVVGDGVVARTSNGGTNWVLLSTPTSEYFRRVFFVDANTGFICGSNGTVLKSTDGGVNWIALTTGTNALLHSIGFADAITGYVTGVNGLIMKTTDGGNNWQTLTSGVSNPLLGIAVVNSDTAYAVTDAGAVMKSTNSGINWIPQTTGTTATLYDICFVNALTGTAVGATNTDGYIMRTTNGGTNWLAQNTGVSGFGFSGVYFTANTTGFAVGGNGTIIYTTTGGFSLPPAPNLTYPPDNAQDVPVNPVLDWDTLPTAKTYDLQLATDTGFTANVIDTTLLNYTSLPVQSGRLLNNVKYYWRVRGVNIVGNGPWSARYAFTTIVALPNAPQLLLPVNNASNVSLTPTFDWDSTSPALYYRLQVCSDTSFALPEVDVTGLLFSTYTLPAPDIQSNTRYYWRAAATNAAGLGPWSAVFTFTTITTLPGPPILVSPPNNSGNISLTPLLDWRDDITSTAYQLQLSLDSTFGTTPVIDSSGFNVSQIAVRSGLLVNLNTYYWRVRTTNALGTGPWSAVWNFLTGLTAPAAPVLLAPPDNAQDISTIVTLDWNNVPYAATYRIQVSADSLFGTFTVNSSGVNVSQFTTNGGQLQNNTQYYWRVNASNLAGTGPFSTVWKFKTVIAAPIAAPNLLLPPNGSVVSTLTPTLDWNDVSGSNGYKVQVAEDSLFISPNPDTFVTSSNLVVPSGILSGNHIYYWRVRAHNVGGYGPWSVVWKFVTSSIGITTISSEIPKEYKLYNNYPNPFNPDTRIRFDLPRTSNVRIVIYDLLGREVTELLSLNMLPAGTYETSWNSTAYASGLYIYRIETKDFVQSKKMLLIK